MLLLDLGRNLLHKMCLTTSFVPLREKYQEICAITNSEVATVLTSKSLLQHAAELHDSLFVGPQSTESCFSLCVKNPPNFAMRERERDMLLFSTLFIYWQIKLVKMLVQLNVVSTCELCGIK